MKRSLVFACICALLLGCSLPVFAADGNVTYSGDAGEFIFAPGSDRSPTNLFPDFESVMPGDSITQTITVRNDASNQVKVKIYVRSLGAHEDSVDFLSQMQLRVEKSGDNTMGSMFDAAASETAQMTDWVLLGTLYSGGEVNLNVILDVPVEMGNDYQYQVGFLEWEFKVEEYPVEPSDPPPPQTGDEFPLEVLLTLMLFSLAAMVLLIVLWKKKKQS